MNKKRRKRFNTNDEYFKFLGDNKDKIKIIQLMIWKQGCKIEYEEIE